MIRSVRPAGRAGESQSCTDASGSRQQERMIRSRRPAGRAGKS
jgi:hypothetical protein